MTRVNKFKKGTEIRTLNRLMQLVIDEKRFIYFRDRPVHPKFVMQWPLVDIYNRLLQGCFFRALPNKDHILFEVWSEGYAATGERAYAYKEGEVWASSFQEACDKAMKGRSTYNSERLSDWGCRLFDNEFDARRSFG